MRRPLAVFGFTLLGCAWLFMVFGITAIDWLMPIAAVGVIATLLLRNRIKQQPIGWAVSGVSWTALFACVIILCATALTNASLPTYHQQKQTLTMTVTEQRGKAH